MFRPLSLYIGLKYTRAKSRNHFISFISWISILGIALGVMVLITVLSVMNGFDHVIKSRILDMVPQVTVTQWGGVLDDWPGVAKEMKKNSLVIGEAPFVESQAMLNSGGSPTFGIVKGIDPKLESTVSPIGTKMVKGKLSDLKAGSFDIILGHDMATNLGVGIGDKVTVVVPKTNLSPVGMLPRIKVFKVIGYFKTGYQYDSSYALVNIKDLSVLLNMHGKVSGLQLKLTDLYQASNMVHWINTNLSGAYRAADWTMQNQNFFAALKMEKMMMFLILMLIIAVAAFNMLSSLVMMVTDKESDIAILRTLGFQSGTLMRVFIVQGMVTGFFGIILGVVLGVVLSLNVTSLVNWIQNVFHVQFLSSSVYYINFVPSQLRLNDVLVVIAISIVLSLLATIYPAFRASRIQPAEALRYE